MNAANSANRGASLRRRPLIGISTGRTGVAVTEGTLAAYYVGRAYVRAMVRAGGTPLILPAVDEDMDAVANGALDTIDALVLPGGCDLSPGLYGGPPDAALDADPVRDDLEMALLQGALERGMPVLGICRGMELINVAYGGTLRDGVNHPDAVAESVSELGLVHFHDVEVVAGTLAADVFGAARVQASCVHHQAPGEVGAGLTASVLADDGSIEAVEDRECDVLGVIWHPELALDRAGTHQLVYDWVVARAIARSAR